MSWQKCPKCNGEGVKGFNQDHVSKCSVCKGYGIISVLTGEPPCYKNNNTNFEGPTKL